MSAADDLKREVAIAALDYVTPGSVLGVGTGSTVNHFIDQLANADIKIKAAVSSSTASTTRLEAAHIPVISLNDVDSLSVYVDGADECDPGKNLIKGGGGALTREKIVAAVSERFICIVDESKMVETLGAFPLPIEVIPMARAYADRTLRSMGGNPVLREGFITDNGNEILDVHGLEITDPRGFEQAVNAIPGIVTVGLFAHRGADTILVGSADGVTTL